MHVNFDHGCSGEREKSDYELVDAKRDYFRRSSDHARARFSTRFLGTMNRISSVFRRNSSSAVMTPTLMGCVISYYRINFSSKNFRRWIIHRFEKNITMSCKKLILKKNIEKNLGRNGILMYQVWSESLSKDDLWFLRMLVIIVSITFVHTVRVNLCFTLLNKLASVRLVFPEISRDYISSFPWADFAEIQACHYI